MYVLVPGFRRHSIFLHLFTLSFAHDLNEHPTTLFIYIVHIHDYDAPPMPPALWTKTKSSIHSFRDVTTILSQTVITCSSLGI